MAENPDYWNTIATVIPVIALTYATALKRGDWHRMKAATRRWIALYSAALVISLVWVEVMALQHLQERTSDTQHEQISLMTVGWAAAQVLAVPIAPLLVIAVHDLHPSVLRAKRQLKSDAAELASVRKQYAALIARMENSVRESKIQGSEQVLVDPSLVYDDAGAVRPGYQKRVSRWSQARDFHNETVVLRDRIAQELQVAEKKLKKSEGRLAKVIRSRTKRAAKITDLHR